MLTVGPPWGADIGVTEDTQFHEIQSVFKEVHVTHVHSLFPYLLSVFILGSLYSLVDSISVLFLGTQMPIVPYSKCVY